MSNRKNEMKSTKETSKFIVMDTYSVFYLIGGSSNFVCKSLFSRYSFADAKKECGDLSGLGYRAMIVKSGHIVGGYLSFSDFDNKSDAEKYYNSLTN